jgi:hypothetical protein
MSIGFGAPGFRAPWAPPLKGGLPGVHPAITQTKFDAYLGAPRQGIIPALGFTGQVNHIDTGRQLVNNTVLAVVDESFQVHDLGVGQPVFSAVGENVDMRADQDHLRIKCLVALNKLLTDKRARNELFPTSTVTDAQQKNGPASKFKLLGVQSTSVVGDDPYRTVYDIAVQSAHFAMIPNLWHPAEAIDRHDDTSEYVIVGGFLWLIWKCRVWHDSTDYMPADNRKRKRGCDEYNSPTMNWERGGLFGDADAAAGSTGYWVVEPYYSITAEPPATDLYIKDSYIGHAMKFGRVTNLNHGHMNPPVNLHRMIEQCLYGYLNPNAAQTNLDGMPRIEIDLSACN